MRVVRATTSDAMEATAKPVEAVHEHPRDAHHQEGGDRQRAVDRERAGAVQRAEVRGPVERHLLEGGHHAEGLQQPTATSHLLPSTYWTMSSANSASPKPNGIPQISASRLDFENDSNSRSMRSLTAHTAG